MGSNSVHSVRRQDPFESVLTGHSTSPDAPVLLAGDDAPPPHRQGGRVAAALDDDGPILNVPYPVEDYAARLRADFPDRLGLFVAGRPRSVSFTANRNAVKLAVRHMGFRVFHYSGQYPTLDTPTNGSGEQETQLELTEETQQLVRALEEDARQSRLSFVFLKPRALTWDRLSNCLTFEPWHKPSLFASDKWHMATILRRRSQLPCLRLTDGRGHPFDYSRFCMYTANPGRGQRAILDYLDANPGVYVLKKSNSSRGIGIHMYHASEPNTVKKLQHTIGAQNQLNRYVLQKYIERPLLVDKRKFDLRVYLLVLTCSCPQRPGERGYFAFCHPGYVKLSSRAYVQGSRDPRVHFTNQFVQRRSKAQYDRVKEATTWLPDELDAYLGRRGRAAAGWCRRRLYKQVQAVAGYLAAAFRPYLESRQPGCVFRVYGPDLIVDEEMKLQLLEFNCFPCYAKNTVALSTSLVSMWREAVSVTTEAALRYRDRRPVCGSDRRPRLLPSAGQNFHLVHSSERPGILQDLVRSCYP